MLLFTPGPTPTPEFIRQAMALPSLHHRTKEFEKYFESARNNLARMLNLPEVIMLASSGTGAMEACVTTFCKKPLVINSGKFGERFGKIARAHNIDFIELKNDWNYAPSASEVEQILLENRNIDSICVQICESSGGLRHNVEEIAKTAKKINENIFVIADGITAIGVEKLDTKNIDALIGGSQKAFMLPPGMAFIGLSPLALDLIEKNDIGFYFNLKTELKNQRKNTTAWTAPTSIIIGLAKYFEVADLDLIYKETRARALACNDALSEIGLQIFPKTPSVAMSAIYHESASEIRKVLKEKYLVNIAGGQDSLKEKLFRINHMGIIRLYEISWVINALELALSELKIRAFDGRANRVFIENYHRYL